MFAELGGRIAALSVRLTALDRDMARLHTRSPVSQLLAEIPGGRPDQRAELRPHGGCLAVQVEASSRRLARPDTEAEVDGRQATAGRDLAPGRRTAAPVAGARRNRRGGHCQTRQPACQRLTAGPAAAPSAQATDRHLLLSPFHPRCQRFRRPSRDGMPHRWSSWPTRHGPSCWPARPPRANRRARYPVPSNGAVRNRRHLESSLAEPIRAAVMWTAPQGRTHDRTRTRRRYAEACLVPCGSTGRARKTSRQVDSVS